MLFKIISTIFVSALLCGCDTFYNIPLSGTSDSMEHRFDSGTLSVYLQVWQGHVFDFYQTYEVTNEVCLYPDSLIIEFKGDRYPCYFVSEKDNPRSLCFSGSRKIRTAFRIEHKVNKGDTIRVIPNGYIYSSGIRMDFRTLDLVLQADLRGPTER